jgi:DNA-binding transcriptional LysR family regulator
MKPGGDGGLLHRPQNDLTGLDAEELFTERQVVVLPEGHRLAQLPVVCLADLAGETMPRWPGKAGRHGDGLVVSDAGQLMQLIALGRLVAVVGESVRGRLTAGLVCRPVADAPAATVVIAWPRSSTSRHVAALVRAATAAAQRRVLTPDPAEPAAAG